MYNDCWPALGYALVDFYGNPKAGWHACRRAYAPVAAAIAEHNGKLVFTILNDSLRTPKVTARILVADTLTGVAKTKQETTVSLPANANLDLLELPLPKENVNHTLYFLEVEEDGKCIARARWCASWLSQLRLTPARLEWHRKGDTLTVRCLEGIALGVAFDGEFVAEDNFFDLLSGEERTLQLRPPFGASAIGTEVTPYAYCGVFQPRQQ